MGHELEHAESAPGSVTPMYGPGAEHVPMTQGRYTHVPVWMELRTPSTPGKGWLAQMDRAWSIVSLPIRAVFLGGLMLTYRWYYIGGVLVTLLFIILLFRSNG